jgi:glycogen operon protein
VVVDTSFDWGEDIPPRTSWQDTLIYETHVRGMTMRHPEVPPELRGTYAGLATPPVITHLKSLGVTAVELLPVQFSVTEPWLARSGLTNYWGYSPIGYFAPQARYAAGADPVAEWKQMVKTLHAAGIEVIVDVVYNHTAEGDHRGPALCYRGIDNPGFYRLRPDDLGRYVDWTGTGNTVDITQPWALQVVMDSLRYWVTEMHVDGFRFDLATVLGRIGESFQRRAGFFAAVSQDPVLRGVKLIAEPWDLGPHGYQLGEFPRGWGEWNGRFRDVIRDFWRDSGGLVDDLAAALTGSAELFGRRGPGASINFITSHDGFTLADLVSHDHKHNLANKEENEDGENHNRSWNSGAEGPTDDPEILALRRRRVRSLLTTLFISQGVPTLLGGDEIGRTQGGNNNAYCQDNEISWYDWEGMDSELVAFTQRLSAFRRQHPVLRRTGWLTGRTQADGLPDVGWFTPEGKPMDGPDWEVDYARTLSVFLNAFEGDSSLLAYFNGRPASHPFTIPPSLAGRAWNVEITTGSAPKPGALPGTIEVEPFGMVVSVSSSRTGG